MKNGSKQVVEAKLPPPLKWAGGKRWLVQHLLPVWLEHQHRRYIEPFCGGLAIALALRPKQALLNDANPHLINFYRQLQKGLALRIDMRNDEQLFYAQRSKFNLLIQNGGSTSAEAAELFYYLNRTCFNGLCRFNQSGEFNVPFGTYKSINYRTDFLSYRAVLRDWVFVNGDFQQLEFDADDFICADPPYDVEFTSYSAGGFSWEDQQRTAEVLARHKGPVVISNQATERIQKLYRQLGYKLQFLDGPRRISRTGDRTAAKEVLAFRNL